MKSRANQTQLCFFISTFAHWLVPRFCAIISSSLKHLFFGAINLCLTASHFLMFHTRSRYPKWEKTFIYFLHKGGFCLWPTRYNIIFPWFETEYSSWMKSNSLRLYCLSSKWFHADCRWIFSSGTGYCDSACGRQHCKCRSPKNRLRIPRPAERLLFCRSTTPTVQTCQRREREIIQL